MEPHGLDAANGYYQWLNRRFLLLQLPVGLLLYGLGEWSGAGGWSLVLWGIPLRLVLMYHATWLVNSATHSWGYVNHPSDDCSRNTWWVTLLTFGEGWHNNLFGVKGLFDDPRTPRLPAGARVHRL